MTHEQQKDLELEKKIDEIIHNIMSKEIKADPRKLEELLNILLKSISWIPDKLRQILWIKYLHSKYNIPEAILTGKLENITKYV